MHAAVLAAITPSDSPHGANLTVIVPVAVFVISAAVLYLRFRRPPQTPGNVALATARLAAASAPAAPATPAAPPAQAASADGAGPAESGNAGAGADAKSGDSARAGESESESGE